MQKRHSDSALYFEEQYYSTGKYIFPYIDDIKKITPEMTVAEIGCSYGGNLKPFLDMGCTVVGIDISEHRIKIAKQHYQNHPNRKNLKLIASDIYDITQEEVPLFDLIFLRDTIEHIPRQEYFLKHIKAFLKEGGRLFFAFPPWRMPFGGHQQACRHPILSKIPYFHILPKRIYRSILTRLGENDSLIDELLELKEIGLSISRFQKYLCNQNYIIEKKTFYLINPNYEVKFRMKPCALPKLMNIPYLRDFFTTICYYILKAK